MIITYAQQLGPWAWFIAGLLLLALEIAAPGAFFLWFGVAAILVGAFSLFFDLAWQTNAIVFIVLALVLVVIGRRYFASRMRDILPNGLNDRALGLIGMESVLGEPIVDGRGRIRVADTTWRVEGPDLPSGTRVKVVGADGAVLKIARA